MVQRYKLVTVKRRLWVSTLGNELLFIIIFVCSLVLAKSGALSFATQYAIPRKIQRKVGNSVLTLGSLVTVVGLILSRGNSHFLALERIMRR